MTQDKVFKNARKLVSRLEWRFRDKKTKKIKTEFEGSL